MRDNKARYKPGKIIFIILFWFAVTNPVWAEDHDLVMVPAPDITSSDSAGWKSPDIKIGSDFDNLSVPDLVRRGITNQIYSRFYINGVEDYTVNDDFLLMRFYYRNVALTDIEDGPPPNDDPGWISIDELDVTHNVITDPFLITKVWPTEFPTVTDRFVNWNVPEDAGEYFYVRSDAVYLPESGVADENPEDNVAISLYESVSGLVDVVLVHDTSGSMGYYSYLDMSYLQHAIARASTFLAAISPNDRFAITEFSSRFPGGTHDVWPPEPASLQLATDTNIGLALGALSTLSASGSTPLGAGIQRAIELLTADEPERKKVILLLSDGYENSGTLRACSGAEPAEPCVGGSLITQLNENNIRVFSMALGLSAWTECLECVSYHSDGQWYPSPDPGINMTNVYLEMQQAYSSDDLYSVDYGSSGGGDDSYSAFFEGIDDMLYFILSWDDLNANVNLQLQPPNGSWTDPGTMSNTKVFSGNGYYVVRVTKAATGSWGYRVVGDNDQDYLVAVRSDQVGVRLTVAAETTGVVGQPIKITARLSNRGKAVTNATLNATVQVPYRQSLETQLRQLSRNYIKANKTIPIDSSMLKQSPDVSPKAVFINNITKGKPETLLKQQIVSVPLKHVRDGVYTGELSQANTIAGAYQVTVKYRNQDTIRTQSKALRLNPGKIDYGKSTAEILEIQAKDEPTKWLLRVYPVDQYHNAITDASLIKQFQPNIRGGHLDQQAVIAFDSAFQQQVIAAPKRKPQLQFLKIGGREVNVLAEDTNLDRGVKGFLLLLLIAIFAM